MIGRFWDRFWRVGLFFRRLACWFTEHRPACRDHWTQAPDYCDKCLVDWPQDRKTLTSYLNMTYCWLVRRDWKWFECFDCWLCDHYGRYLPRWWEF